MYPMLPLPTLYITMQNALNATDLAKLIVEAHCGAIFPPNDAQLATGGQLQQQQLGRRQRKRQLKNASKQLPNSISLNIFIKAVQGENAATRTQMQHSHIHIQIHLRGNLRA